MGQLQSIESKLINMGYQIVAMSPDRPEELKKTVSKNKLNYLLVSDSQMVAAKAFGVAFQLSDKVITMYKGFGINLDKTTGEGHHQLPVPSVFIVVDGVVEFQYVNPNVKVRLDPELLAAAAKRAIAKK